MRLLVFSILLFLFFSCSDKPKQDTIAVLSGNENFLPDSSKQRLLKIIEGGWVNEEYIDAFKKLSSPMYAAAFGLPRQQMAFDISHLDGDTLINALGRLNYNEQERFAVIFYRKTDGKIGMKINAGKDTFTEPPLLNYSIEGKDTILLLTTTQGKTTTTNRYRRQFRDFPETDGVQVTSLEYFVNEALFSGDWKMQGKTISFSPDGRVKNFHVYKRYSVSTEEENASSRPDEISFYNDSTGVTYAFTYDHGRMQLYEVRESDDGMTISRGKMAGEMERIY